jgi:hypothetical protein
MSEVKLLARLSDAERGCLIVRMFEQHGLGS